MITCLSASVVPTATAEEQQPEPYAQVQEEGVAPVEYYVPNRDEPSAAQEIAALDPGAPDVDGYYRDEPPSEAPPEDLPEPQDEVTPGMMRSDIIGVPEGYTKQEADRAEVREAQLDKRPLTRAAGQTCKVFWPSPYQVCGAILERYEVIGGPVSWLGLPKSNELVNPEGVGRRSEFLGGNIYWHPSHGAHSVAPDAAKQWNTLGYETGRLGYPVGEAFSTSTPLIYGQRYSGGDIYYSPLTGGAVWGDIKARYDQLGGANHPIGVPITNEIENTDAYRYTNFSNGTMSWRGTDRATRFMYFNTQKVWDALGRETGEYGFPSGDEMAREPGVFHIVNFADRGVIGWSSLFGARELAGQAYIYWDTQLETSNDLGYPIPDVLPFSLVSTQRFSRGSIMGSGENIAVIPRSDAPHLNALTENEYPSSEEFNETSPGLRRSDVVSQGFTPEEDRKDEYPDSGYRVSNKTPETFPKDKPYVGDNHFVVRKGFFEEDWSTGDDLGWGQEKMKEKHNMYNHPILFAVINEGVMNSDLSHEKNTYPYTERVFFLKCGQF
ncbi:LGFP repeat-containing protein, partial [uncultured Corynebacterium sp.]|uniref:LGFP repeat-containing protein n=1 Tax=uncultured Corynebacterium sp. TaxID=159447 RepID=UPI0025F59511